MKKHFFYLVLSLLIVNDTCTQSKTFIQKTVAPDRLLYQDYFGQKLVMDGDYALIGAWGNSFDQVGNNYLDQSGAVYVYKKPAPGLWILLEKLVASDRTALDAFGYGLSIDSNAVVIGAPFEGAGFYESAGAFYVFENENGVLTEKQKLFAPDREYLDEFGWKLGISGDWIIVGSPRDSEDENGENYIGYAGSAYLYHRIGGEWIFSQKILASDRGEVSDRFGVAVAISGDYAAVGSDNNNNDSGAVYIFKNEGGVWIEHQKLTIKAPGFGGALTMNGTQLIVRGAGGAISGSAYIFEFQEDVWSEKQRLDPSDGREFDFFATSIDVEGDNIVVGASGNDFNVNNTDYCPGTGAAYLYQKNEAGIWVEIQKIVAPDRNPSLFEYYPQGFGNSVAISEGFILSGADDEPFDENGENYIYEAGAAYFFQNDVLPLGFSALTGEKKNNKNILYWQTFTETNLQNMQVQRSTDGVNFQTIATVAAHNIASNYSYEDAAAVAGVTNFYKISFNETDGRKNLSNTISIAATTIPFTISIRPNPFTTKFSVVANTGLSTSTTMSVHWYNTSGRLVYTEIRFLNTGDNTISLNTAALAKGVYMVEFMLNDGRRVVEKVVKE